MAKHHIMFLLFTFIFWAVLFSETSAVTDPLDVTTLQGLYISLNFPPQLTGWKFVGGDPCGESWEGIKCSGDAIQSIKICGLQITGTMAFELASLRSLEELDISNNSIHGVIPLILPPSATHINLAFNQLTQNIPFSLASLKSLRYLNLRHNSLSGSIGDIFTGLENLKQMDLSYNSFTGNLPISFVTLTSLTVLDLQNNQFTGSVNFLAGLPLSYLNIRNNYFSGVVPMQFELISNLRSLLISPQNGAQTESPELLSVDFSSVASPSPLPTIRQGRSKSFYRRINYMKRNGTPMTAKLYNVTELQAATNNFSEVNLLGMGIIGTIYKRVFPDGQILTVNIIEMVLLSLCEEDLFLDVISSISHLRHPNIASLLGYCVEHGQHFLGYAYVGNVSLIVALHSTQDIGKTLTWNDRLRISIGVAMLLSI